MIWILLFVCAFARDVALDGWNYACSESQCGQVVSALDMISLELQSKDCYSERKLEQ